MEEPIETIWIPASLRQVHQDAVNRLFARSVSVAGVEAAVAHALDGGPSMIRAKDDGVSFTPIPLEDFYAKPD